MKNKYSVESVDTLCVLRRKITRVENRKGGWIPASLGFAQLDSALGGGLARGQLHEVFAREPADSGSAAGFTAILAYLVSQGSAPLFWLREEAAERQAFLHAAGLAEIGIDPGRIVLILLADPVALLRAAVDVLRCASVGAVVIELWRQPRTLDLTASRRLVLAAEASGVTPLLLRIAAQPGTSAAQTRWSIRSAPSMGLEADAPGNPAFIAELLRQRGRPDGGRWHLEWDRDRARFDDATLSGVVVPPAASGPLAEDGWRQVS